MSLKEKLDELSLEVTNHQTKNKINLKGFKGIKSFVVREKNFWVLEENKSSLISEFQGFYVGILDELDQLENIENQSTFDNKWNQIYSKLSKLILSKSNLAIYLSTSSYAQDILTLAKNNDRSARAYHKFLSTGHIEIVNSKNITKEDIFGYLKAFQTIYGDLIEDESVKVEKDSIIQLKNYAEGEIQTLLQSFVSQQREYEKWKNEYTKEHSDWKQEHIEWVKTKEDEITSLIDNKTEEFDTLKKLYEEDLKTKGPVKYWKDRAKILKDEGDKWRLWFIGSIAGLAILLIIILYKLTEGLAKNIVDIDAGSIKSVLILFTIISLGAYLIRLFSKLTFSSYHLQRDSEEREHLTHIYLALLEKGAIDEKERNLILQSLFSRAETGLIGKDNSPSMPGKNLLDKLQS